MTEGYAAAQDEIPDGPPEARERPSEPRTRSVRRPAAGSRRDAPRKPSTRRRAKAPSPAPEVSPADAIRGLMQMPAAALIITGQRTESVALVADGATVLIHGPAVAQAIEEIARNDPRVMALLEKLLAFGPYGVLIAALMPMVAQFVRNHEAGPAPILEGFGAVPPDQIISAASLDVPVSVSPNGQGSREPSPEE
jgi:hypothetical protein